MKQVRLVVSALICASLHALAQPAFAQPAESVELPLAQHVVEQLAAKGTSLPELGVELKLEEVGDKLLVSLVDASTRRPLASTKLDAVPEDREAAAVSVTKVVASLISQLGNNATAAAVNAVLSADRAERKTRELAEYRFRQEAIYFGSEVAVATDFKTFAYASTQTVAYQGDVRRSLHGRDFYTAVHRPDLADEYSHRRRTGVLMMFGGLGAMVAGSVMAAKGYEESEPCYEGGKYVPCGESGTVVRNLGIIVSLGGIMFGAFGAVRTINAHPVSVDERYRLAVEHNTRLREKYGLPVSSSRPRAPRQRDVALAPYVGSDGGGVMVLGRF